MDIIERIYLDNLSIQKVSVRKQKVAIIDGTEYFIDEPLRCAYMNSYEDREKVESEIPSPYKEAIFAVWGDNVIVE